MKKGIYLALLTNLTGLLTAAQPGSLEAGFGNNGKIAFHFSTAANVNGESGQKVFELPDGKILAVFSAGNFYMSTRLQANGNIDLTYGNNGYSDILLLTATNAAIQPDGKIVIVGSKEVTEGATTNNRLAVGRLGANGKSDITFGSGGIVVLNDFIYGSQLRPIVVQTDGKIMIGTQSIVYSPTYVLNEVLIRLNPDGSFDNTFGINGVSEVSFPELPGLPNYFSLSVNNENKIIAVGSTYLSSQQQIVIVKYGSNGNLDNAFGNNGKQIINPNLGATTSLNLKTATLQADGKIVVAGSVSDYLVYPYNVDIFTTRILSDGTLDNSFNGTGSNITDITTYDMPLSVAVQPDGKIVVAGQEVFAARYNVDGTLDSDFGNGGKITSSDFTLNNGIVATSTGNILVTGGMYVPVDSYIRKYNSSGDPDNSFSADGVASIYLAGGVSAINNLFKLADGKFLCIGTEGQLGQEKTAFARLLPNGSSDLTFGTDGKLVTSYSSFGLSKMQQDGKVLITSANSLEIFRFDNNGNIDPTFANAGVLTLPEIPDYYPSVFSIESQANGKILVLSRLYSVINWPEVSLALIRFNQDGAVDPTFGNNGVQKLLAGTYNDGHAIHNRAFADGNVQIRNDGKIVVFGSLLQIPQAVSRNLNFYIARLNADGSFDNDFDGDGRLISSFVFFSDFIRGAILADNKLLINLGFEFRRLNEDGSLDNSFGTSGTAYSGISGNIRLQDDGKILQIGAIGGGGNALARFNADGTLDAGFGNNGIVTIFEQYSEGRLTDLLVVNNTAYAFGSSYVPFQSAAIHAYRLSKVQLACPANAIAATVAGQCSAAVNNIDPVLTPAGAVATVNYTLSGATTGNGTGSVSEHLFNIGVTTVNYRLADDPAQTCSFTVTISPSPEVCNGIDDDCDGQVDEGCNTTSLPKISINNTNVEEGNNGTRNATFVLHLSKRSNIAVTVQYQTANNTAIAPDDYIQKSGTVTFPPNNLVQNIVVQVKGDKLNEANEKFSIQLSNAVNATINVGSATCTINNDDPIPSIRINDASTSESSQLALVKVDLSEASGQNVKVKYDTKDGSAKAPADYIAISNGTVEFQPGETTKNISIVVKQDALNESTEKLEVKLKQPENATLARKDAEVRITNSAPALTKNAPATTASTNENGITVSPNPANQQLNLRFFGKKLSGKIQVDLVDQSGRVVKQWMNNYNSEGQSVSLQVADIASGIYIVVIKDGRGRRVQYKVVVQH